MTMENPRAVDAIIFDLDGTLVNSLPDITAGVNHVRGLRGLPLLAEETVRTYIGDGVNVLLARALDTDNADEIHAGAADFRPFYDKHCLDGTVLYDGVVETLARFSDKKLAIVSNKPEEFTNKILNGLGIAKHFDIVLGPESVRRQKPDPESNQMIARAFGVAPGRFCTVGDRSTDVDAGRAAGMMTVGVTYGLGDAAEVRKSGPDVILDQINKLAEYIM